MIDNSIEDADKALTSLAKRGGRAIKILLAGLIIIVIFLGGGVGYLLNQNTGETKRIDQAVTSAIQIQQVKNQASCSFYGLLAPIPPGPTSTKLTAELLLDSRIAYDGLGCKPALPPISPALISLAHKYDVPIPKGK